MYYTHLESLKGPSKREFLHEAEDWEGLRQMDREAFSKEGDLDG